MIMMTFNVAKVVKIKRLLEKKLSLFLHNFSGQEIKRDFFLPTSFKGKKKVKKFRFLIS